MKQCKFCGASLPDYASFCGKCGQTPFPYSEGATYLNNASGSEQEDIPTLTEDISLSLTVPLRQEAPPFAGGVPRPVTLIPLHDEKRDEDEDEEKRRRVALLGMGLLLPEQLARLPMSGPPPVIAGTPQIAQVPVIPNTLPTSFPSASPAPQGVTPTIPQLHGSGFSAQQIQSPQPYQIQQPQSPPATPPAQAGKHPSVPAHHSGSFGHHQANPPRSRFPKPGRRLYPHHFPGCLTMLAIFLAALMAIAGASLALATTIFAPGLAVSGSANVTPGGVLILHGSNFLPNSNVTLTFDNNIPVLLSPKTSIQPTRNTSQGLDSAALALSSFQVHTAYNMLSTHSDGTFNATIQVEQAWAPGHHTIHATEVTSQRSASLSFMITQATATVTATPTPSPTATATAITTPTPSPTATAPTPSPTTAPTPSPTTAPTPSPTTAPKRPPTLSCATPGNLSLGPINASSSQPASANVTLCSSGSGTLTWKASWDQDTAPWLQISQSSGSIQAPHSTQLTISASAAELTAGTYTTTITFTGIESNTTQKVNITLTVQSPPPTISVNPTSVDADSAPCNNSSGGDSGGGDSICTITLTNNSSTTDLDWSWSATGNGSVQADSTTIAAGGTETVDIYIPYADCGTQITVTFTAPGNAVDVTWNCTPSTPTPTPTPPSQPTNPIH